MVNAFRVPCWWLTWDPCLFVYLLSLTCTCSAGAPWPIVGGAVAGVVIIALVVVVVVIHRRSKNVIGPQTEKDRPTVAFTNPVYETSQQPTQPAFEHDDGDNLYDDVAPGQQELYDEPSISGKDNRQICAWFLCVIVSW